MILVDPHHLQHSLKAAFANIHLTVYTLKKKKSVLITKAIHVSDILYDMQRLQG